MKKKERKKRKKIEKKKKKNNHTKIKYCTYATLQMYIQIGTKQLKQNA